MPETTSWTQLEDALHLSSNYIRRLTVNQLLPPVKQRTDADDTADDDTTSMDHFDFNSLLPRLPFLEDFEVTYGVRDCGMNFDWTLFQFTSQDCRLLSQCIATCRTLRSLTLHRSKVTHFVIFHHHQLVIKLVRIILRYARLPVEHLLDSQLLSGKILRASDTADVSTLTSISITPGRHTDRICRMVCTYTYQLSPYQITLLGESNLPGRCNEKDEKKRSALDPLEKL